MTDESELFCARAAAEAGESLLGTAAADTDVWLALELRSAWAAKPERSEGLPDGFRDRLQAWLEALPRTRLQLIRRPGRTEGPVRLYVGFSGDSGPWLLALDRPDLAAVLDLDVPALVAAGAHPLATPVEEPVHLVCTHGKRDRCCAVWGQPVYQTLSQVAPEHVWHTSHTGGHRFAANVISLPHGISYGRLTPQEAPALVEAHRRRRLHDLDRVRGRTCYDAPTQAAEVFLRRDAGELGLEAVRHRGTEMTGEDRWLARFEVNGELHEVPVAREGLPGSRPKSCGDPATPLDRYVRP